MGKNEAKCGSGIQGDEAKDGKEGEERKEGSENEDVEKEKNQRGRLL